MYFTVNTSYKLYMRFIYPAIFRKNKEGGYDGFFPDLEDCKVKGETLEDAVDEANEACLNWLSAELSEEDPQLPSISEKDDMNLQPGDEVRNIAVTIRFHVGWDE